MSKTSTYAQLLRVRGVEFEDRLRFALYAVPRKRDTAFNGCAEWMSCESCAEKVRSSHYIPFLIWDNPTAGREDEETFNVGKQVMNLCRFRESDDKLSGKQTVRLIGCGLCCLIICVLAVWNRTLFLEPAVKFMQHHIGFEEAKNEFQDNYLSDRPRGKHELLSLNGGYARLMGRTKYNGVQTLTNGMLSSSMKNINTTAFAENVERYYLYLKGQGIPFLYIIAPHKVPTEDNLLPTGATDLTNKVGDRVFRQLTERNVPVLDLRKDMSQTREQIETYFYRTDHHWNVEGSFFAYQQIMQAIQSYFPETKMTYTDSGLWEKTILPDWWLGSLGKRVGPLYGGVEDLDYYLPTFETYMARYTPGMWVYKGDFQTVNIRDYFLIFSDYMRMDSYERYLGGYGPVILHRNPSAENQRKIMLVRDSFMSATACFLSTEFTSIDTLDPREYYVMSILDYTKLNPPEMVIMMNYPGSLTYKQFWDFGDPSPLEVVKETSFEDITLSPLEDSAHYAILPARLEKGKSYQLTLEHIQVTDGDPAGASAALYCGDEIADQTVFSIEYGNQFDFLWGFQVPEEGPDESEYQLRLYDGVSGGTENTGLTYQGICLRECAVAEP